MRAVRSRKDKQVKQSKAKRGLNRPIDFLEAALHIRASTEFSQEHTATHTFGIVDSCRNKLTIEGITSGLKQRGRKERKERKEGKERTTTEKDENEHTHIHT
jgi:hypothetical protein